MDLCNISLYAGVLFVCTRSSRKFHSGSHNGTARFVVYCTCAKYRVAEYYHVCRFINVILESLFYSYMAFFNNIFLFDFRTLPTMWYFLFLYQILELLSHFNKKLTVYTSFISSILFIQIKVIKHKNKNLINKKTKKNTQSTKHQTINTQMNKTTRKKNNKQDKKRSKNQQNKTNKTKFS